IETEHPAQGICLSATHCAVVAGGVAFATDDGGAQWNRMTLPAATEAPASLSCPSPTDCVAVANDAVGRPRALTPDDGGTTWTAHALAPKFGGLLAVDCPTTTSCTALATTTAPATNHQIAQALRSRDGGATWTAGVVADRRGVLDKLTCPS